MKVQSTIITMFITALFVLGFVLPVAAEQVPQPFKAVGADYSDWWDEFDDQDVIYNDTTHDPVQKKPVEFSTSGSGDLSSDSMKNGMMDKNGHATPDNKGGSFWMIDEDW